MSVIFRCFERCDKSRKGLLKSLSHCVVRNCQLPRDDKQPEYYVCVFWFFFLLLFDQFMIGRCQQEVLPPESSYTWTWTAFMHK